MLVAEPGDHLDDERVELLYGLCPAHPGFEGVSQGSPVDSGEGAVEIVGVDGVPDLMQQLDPFVLAGERRWGELVSEVDRGKQLGGQIHGAGCARTLGRDRETRAASLAGATRAVVGNRDLSRPGVTRLEFRDVVTVNPGVFHVAGE
ncbi:MAG: hypothetical protein QOJ59_4610 [Thermomicrobiales bacterium]|nr:hypothetical protein [Thermomicrobiales bacterium]